MWDKTKWKAGVDQFAIYPEREGERERERERGREREREGGV